MFSYSSLPNPAKLTAQSSPRCCSSGGHVHPRPSPPLRACCGSPFGADGGGFVQPPSAEGWVQRKSLSAAGLLRRRGGWMSHDWCSWCAKGRIAVAWEEQEPRVGNSRNSPSGVVVVVGVVVPASSLFGSIWDADQSAQWFWARCFPQAVAMPTFRQPRTALPQTLF